MSDKVLEGPRLPQDAVAADFDQPTVQGVEIPGVPKEDVVIDPPHRSVGFAYDLWPGHPDFSYTTKAFSEGRVPTHEETMKDVVSGARGRQLKRLLERRQLNPEAPHDWLATPRSPEPPAGGMSAGIHIQKPLIPVRRNADHLERLLTESVEDSLDSVDKGAKAREALMAYQEQLRQRKRKRIRFWTGWLVFLLLITGIIYGTWKTLPEYVVTGRYTVTSECKASFDNGKGEITGKREYSYAYKSLLGYHLVDEGSALERTVINVNGDRLTVLGWDQKTGKTWRQNIGAGERGIAILKHADLYWFLSDKGMATVPYTAFCN